MSDREEHRWSDTIIDDLEQYNNVEMSLFPTDFLDPIAFASTEVLYRCDLTLLLPDRSWPAPRLLPIHFDAANLNDAIMTACHSQNFEMSAFWWNVNVHDNIARCVERVGFYNFADPLEPLFHQLAHNPAQEGGTSYAGLIDRQYRWALSLESGNEFIISIHGSSGFCRAVTNALKSSRLA